MATSSFTKDFSLKTQAAVDSFAKILSAPAKIVKIDRNLVSAESTQRGEEKLKRMLSRRND